MYVYKYRYNTPLEGVFFFIALSHGSLAEYNRSNGLLLNFKRMKEVFRCRNETGKLKFQMEYIIILAE